MRSETATPILNMGGGDKDVHTCRNSVCSRKSASSCLRRVVAMYVACAGEVRETAGFSIHYSARRSVNDQLLMRQDSDKCYDNRDVGNNEIEFSIV
jgi:hypothetical protein